MSEDIEKRMRRALRPIEPPAGFTERLMRALPERAPRAAPAPVVRLRTVPRAGAWQRFFTPAALAASLMVAVLVGRQVGIVQQQHEQRAGLEASRELMQALRVTSQKLDLAYQAVKTPPEAVQGTEENRS